MTPHGLATESSSETRATALTERVDVFKLTDKSFELQAMGSFEVSHGKISSWRDYFDMSQFTSRMG